MAIYKVEDYTGTDQSKIEQAITAANAEASAEVLYGIVPVVEFAPKVYQLTAPIEAIGISLVGSAGGGQRSTILNFDSPTDGWTLVTFRSVYGGVFRDLKINCSGSDASDLIGLYTRDLGSCSLERFEVDLSKMGFNCTCLISQRITQWQESVQYEKFKLTGARPLIIRSGDNLQFSNFDIGAWCTGVPGTTYPFVDGANINAGIQFEGAAPFQVTIGPGSIQEGDHAIYLKKYDVISKGGVLNIHNVRYEQGREVKTGIEAAAFIIHAERAGGLNAMTSLSFNNCQSASRAVQTDIRGIDAVENSAGCVWAGGDHAGQWAAPDAIDWRPSYVE